MLPSCTHEFGALARWPLAVIAVLACLASRGAFAQPPPADIIGFAPGAVGVNGVTQGPSNQPPSPLAAPPSQPLAPPSGETFDEFEEEWWGWQALPDGLIYRSYLGGPREPRLGVVLGQATGFGNVADATLGGRVALVRYGTARAYRPEGFEIDFEGAALARIQPFELSAPLTSTDYRFGFPITYGCGDWQFKTGYAHVSAHLGDEYMELHPGITRINYVRDAIMFGVGYYYTEDLRLYFETDYAAGIGGGALPWQFQLGADYSPAVRGGAPFAAVYADIRPEVKGGYFVVQAGWQWRGGLAMHTFRVGVQYLNGMSPQYEFFRQFEQDVGVGIWYDY